MKEYLQDFKDVLSSVSSSVSGLTSSEAGSRLEKNGKNKLAEGKKQSLISRFLSQLADPMIIILIVAAVISAVTAAVGGEGEGYADVIIIMVVVLINAVLGVYQESKAEKAIEALQEIAAATSKVMRDGKLIDIKSEDLVIGDVVVLEAGDSVPADCRIISCASMKIEEAALTGESVPVSKTVDAIDPLGSDDVPLGDRKNMCYMGSNVVYGHGQAVVVATGMDTEMGKIADALATAEEGQTPLQLKLAQLSKILSFLVLGICVFIFAFDIIRSLVTGNAVDFSSVLDTFMVAVSLAVAAIPEGLAAVVTIVLSIGVTKMSKRNAVIRQLTAVETLGCTQIICSDKTGTLTQNKMTVVEYKGDEEKLLASAMALCCDAQLQEDGTIKGEPTEAALVAYAQKLGLPKYELEEQFPRVMEAPFDSSRKMMSTVHKTKNGFVQYTKGAPDIVLSKCTTYIENGRQLEMTDEKRNEISAENKAMADKALRVLCCAMRTYADAPESQEADYLENNLCYIGLTGMIDPVRPEVVDAIKECRDAGIRPIMITGDHKDTAVAIAKDLGIIADASGAITGAELDKISDEDFMTEIEKYSVYARVQPEHKVRIVKTWRAKGMITAMTGDGVNDAPSIKNADIGVGMGITGTDVTKNVADMVLADDNFATIVSAVEEGRRIYDNIRNSIQFLLSSNLSEVLSIFIATLLGFTLFEPVHLLWINLITDCFPALALGLEKGEKDIMKRKPRNSKDGIFAGGMGFDCVYQGIMVTVLTLAAYIAGIIMASGTKMSLAEVLAVNDVNNPLLHQNGMTMAFLTLAMSEIFHSFNMRSRRQSIAKMGSINWYLVGAMVLSLVLSTAVIYIPFLAKAFDFAHISMAEYLTAMVLAILVIPIVEIVKAIQRAVKK
ncbi:MAG: cation-translocating P-type ATPase [Acetobacter sp.]|nr:cation-translocating P-type ATPase [Bacteroides sp.]MCM1340415.1 cation-translocating P-type ATPase [Acetobacter sp.]MCM1432938.1 cation-translocating P-type ATPase [Clostridiales bacterium]